MIRFYPLSMRKFVSILILFILLSVASTALFSNNANAGASYYKVTTFNTINNNGMAEPFNGEIYVVFYLNHTTSSTLKNLESYIKYYNIDYSISKNLKTMFLSGNSFNFEKLFNDKVYKYSSNGSSYYSFTTPYLPAQFQNTIYWIAGLNNYTKADTNIDIASNVISGPYDPQEIRYAYDVTPFINTGYEGQGNTIAIIDAYGDPNLSSDLAYYSKNFGLPPVNYTITYPFGTPNNTKQGWQIETAIDVECAFSMAPKAHFLIVITPDDSGTLEEAVSYVIDNDLANIISISWGATESSYYDPGFHTAFEQAAAENITVVAASGDNGSGGGVEYPASDPYVTSVGATALYMNSININNYSSYSYDYETAWDKSGGGFSTIFTAPIWQRALGFNNTMRGVPDISFVGDPSTGVEGYVNGTMETVGGTSVSTPLFAGMVADLNQYYHHPLGFINPYLYSAYNYNNSNHYFHEITNGSNGAYTAREGWNPVTGLGSLNLYNTVINIKNLTFEVGSKSTIANNQGIEAEIRTEYSSTSANIIDYFWIGENISNAGFVKFGYFLKNETSGLFVKVYNYTTAIFNYTYPLALGSNNFLNTYKILFNSKTLRFYFNSVLILNLSYISINDNGYSGQTIYYAVAETKNPLSTYSPLGPVEFKSFMFLENGSWNILNYGTVFKHSTKNIYSAYSALEIPYTNDDFIAGLIYQNENQSHILWPYSQNYTKSVPLIIKNNDLTLYNGVYPGTGTKTDPYRIIGYYFSSASIDLRLINVNEYVIISHNIFKGSLLALYVKDSKNIIIENNTFSNNDLAILLRNSQVPVMSNNSFDGNSVILFSLQSSVTLKNNIQNSNIINYIFIFSNFVGLSFFQLFSPASILFIVILIIILLSIFVYYRKKSS
ncbi:MAG: S8 family serine peptidase [Thermoplasmata archaeon]